MIQEDNVYNLTDKLDWIITRFFNQQLKNSYYFYTVRYDMRMYISEIKESINDKVWREYGSK